MPDATQSSEPARSPCTGVCTYGPNRLCIGCLRSRDEIGNWLSYSDFERRRILSELPGRLETLFSL